MAKSFKTAKTIKLFLDECEEYVDSLNQDLVSMEQGEFSEDLLQRVSRNLHTLKGSSAMLEFMDISEIAHAAEDTLDELKAQLPSPAEALIDDIFNKVDKMSAVMAAIKDGSYEEGAVKPSGGAETAPKKPEAEKQPPPRKPAPEPDPEPPPAPKAPPAQAEPAPRAAVESISTHVAASQPPDVPSRPAHTGRTNMFEIFGPSLRVALDRCFTVFNDFDSKYVLADDNVDNPEFFRKLMEMSTYLYNSLMGMGEPRVNELLTRILMLLNRVTAGDIPRTEEIFEAVFTGVSAVKAIIENYIAEDSTGEVVEIQPIVQKIELKMAVLKDQRDYMTLESARELFDRFDVDSQIGGSLTPFEKFNIAHSMIEGLNIFDFEIKFMDSDKDDMASMGDFLKPLVDTGRFVACMIWQRAQNEKRLECHFHMYYGSEKSAEEVTSTYGHLSRLPNLEMSQISISGTTHARSAAPPQPAPEIAAPIPEPLPRAPVETIDTDEDHEDPVLVSKPSAKSSASKTKTPAAAKRKAAAMSTVRVDTNKLDVLVNLIAELVINHNKMEGEIKEFKHTMNRVGDILDTLKMVRKSADLSELNITMDDIMEPFRNLNTHHEVPGLNQLQPASLTDFRNMRSLQDQVGQLFDMELEKDQVISSTLEQVTDLKGNLDGLLSEFQNDGLNIGRVIEELQDETMKLRMLPISGVFNKFPRRVRDMAKQLGKRIDFQMEGEDTELDKTLIEEIEEPLLHIIRNAIDHGVEKPDVRIQQGKPGTGIIKASAYHEGNSVVVEVEDNGRGIDPEQVKQSALNKRLISMEEAENMDEKDAINLIFHPGFSTTTQVTDLSGRGVGMDVVKNSIAKLKGMVDVQTEVGGGTKFKLKLPLTLAIIQAMIVKSHGQKFVIPMDPIESTEQLTAYDISSGPAYPGHGKATLPGHAHFGRTLFHTDCGHYGQHCPPWPGS